MWKKYLLGGDAPHMAGDGLGVVPRVSPADRSQVMGGEKKKGSTTSQGSATTSINGQAFLESMQLPQSFQDSSECSQSVDLTVALGHPSSSDNDSSAPSPRILVLSERERKNNKEYWWQDFEVPAELGLVDESMPGEIKGIIRELFDEHKVLQLSRAESTIENEAQTESSDPALTGDLVPKTDNLAMAQTHSSTSSQGNTGTDKNSSVFGKSQESITTIGSDTSDRTSSKSTRHAKRHLTSPRHFRRKTTQDEIDLSNLSPVSATTGIETRFQEAKNKSVKSRGIYYFLNRRKRNLVSAIALGAKAVPASCECISCFEDTPHHDAADGLSCRHRYCRPCFTQLVNTTILNEETFPPKCCLTEIPRAVMRKYLIPEELSKFDEKSLEYAVPLTRRFYCINSECSRWIDTRIAERTNGALECPHCKSKLCTICRGPQHPGNQDCPQDFGLDATLQEAEQAGWRRCHNCGAMVELNSGCRHITCKCRAEFCYTCGAVWRTCQCTEEDQRRRETELQAARVQREADARAEEEELRRAIAAVEAAEQRLREEREAEEAREEARIQQEAEELAQRELERVDRVNEHYAELRAILDLIGMQQKEAIEKRHFAKEEANDKLQKDLHEVISEREAEINSEQDVKTAENDRMIRHLQKKHASTVMETFRRHRRDQEELFTKDIKSSDGDPDIAKAAMLEALLPLQELERTTLKQQQAREIEKWKLRSERTRRMNTAVKIQQMRFEEEEKLAGKIDTFNRQQEAEWRWYDVLHAERLTMLAEDKRRLISTGGDVGGEGSDIGNSM